MPIIIFLYALSRCCWRGSGGRVASQIPSYATAQHRRSILVINVFRSCFCIDGLLLLETFFIFIVFFLSFRSGSEDFSQIYLYIFVSLSFGDKNHRVSCIRPKNEIKRKRESRSIVVAEARLSITTGQHWHGWDMSCEMEQSHTFYVTVEWSPLVCSAFHIHSLLFSSFIHFSHVAFFGFYYLCSASSQRNIFFLLLFIYRRMRERAIERESESALSCYRHAVVAMGEIWLR